MIFIVFTSFFFRDLLNEPRCVKCAPGTVAAWYAEMAAYVKSLDPNHLVTTGEEGFYATSDNKANPGAAGCVVKLIAHIFAVLNQLHI